jgi:hypothetical protein
VPPNALPVAARSASGRADVVQQRPAPPRPYLVRKPPRAFGWLDARLVRDERASRLGPDATAVLLFLALVADRQGASFYGREKMAVSLGLDRARIDRALDRLLLLELVDHRPWREGLPDGVWQLLPLPPPAPRG